MSPSHSQRQIYNIPAHMPFSDVLARVLLAHYNHRPLELSKVQIFVPTRRAVRNLSQSFLRQSQGRALLLPRFHTLGDLDEDELATADIAGVETSDIAALTTLQQDRTPWNEAHRLLIAVKMLTAAEYNISDEQSSSQDQKLAIAASLLRLLDQSETEGLDIANLSTLVSHSGLTEHWQKSLRFLNSLSNIWPTLEKDFGKISMARLRRLKAEAQVELWKLKPPQGPIIAAGTTASIPATRQLLLAIDRLPNSQILLPGLDTVSAYSAKTWALIGSDPTHPQYGLAQLCQSLDIHPTAIPTWPDAADEIEDKALNARIFLAQWASLPPRATQPEDPKTMGHKGWRELPPIKIANSQEETWKRYGEALRNIELVEATDQNEEAKIIALILRHTLDNPGKTAALVTPNRHLARMVSAQMLRWGVSLDDSAGTPLDKSPAAILLRSVFDVVCDHATPSSLLDLLKNPLVQNEQWPSPRAVLVLEQHALRGPQPGQGLSGVRTALVQKLSRTAQDNSQYIADLEAGIALIEQLQHLFTPLTTMPCDIDIGVAIKTLCATVENLVSPDLLWHGDAGRSLATLLASIHEDESTAAVLKISDIGFLRNFLFGLINKATVRLPFDAHPRISVLGTLEARLLNVDHVILGGLNEDSFPVRSEPGPWLSRAMRAQFGLPPLERKIGLTAHDFIQSMGNRYVTMTRSLKESGAQTTASRFLRRLESYFQQLSLSQGLDLLGKLKAPIDPALTWKLWARTLDQPIVYDTGKIGVKFADPQPSARPKPIPSIDRRPHVLSATEIEAWRANPYALYAKHVLQLRPWEKVEATADARLRGTLIHAAAEIYIKTKEAARKGDKRISLGTAETDLSFFMQSVRTIANELQISPTLQALWWSRIENAAHWFLDTDRLRRLNGLSHSLIEVTGNLNFNLGEAPKQLITIKARADRIDLHQDGRLAIIDYKTGSLPTSKDVFQGTKPQLTIEALILREGQIDGLPRQNPEKPAPLCLEYWQLGGGTTPGAVKTIDPEKEKNVCMSMDEALADIQERFQHMLVEGLTKPTPLIATASGFGDYHHLSRLQEWSSLETSIQHRLVRDSKSPSDSGR